MLYARHFFFTIPLWMAGTITACAEPPQAQSTALAQEVNAFLGSHCATCHGGEEPEGGLPFDRLSELVPINDSREVWLKVVRMVAGGEMPPESELPPEPAEKARFLQAIQAELDQFDCRQHVKPGRVTIRRLNRTEYNNTIRDLIGIDFQPAKDFPADDVGAGFDNLGEVLSLPPLLMEKYLESAEEIMSRAMRDDAIRQRLLGEIPPAKSDAQAARRSLAAFARRAYRRPPKDNEIDRLCELFELANRGSYDFVESMQFAMQAVLVSPHFLFRIELDEQEDPSQARPLTSHELAARLSYFLWSTMPDEELFRLADDDRLIDDQVLAQQVDRMLQDEKSQSLVVNFAGQWLELRNLAKMAPAAETYPSFNEELRAAMRRETELFVRSIISENRSVLDFIDCDYTFLNEQLARHYGIEGVEGDEFQRVALTDRRRGGLLTQASILTLTSNPTRTSPVKRGKWILENILGEPPPPPPPNVEQLAEGESDLLGSLRERMQQHREDPNCAMCHKKMDTLGFGFENYDGVGQWRDKDGRFDIDASGQLPGNTSFNGPAELRQIIKTAKTDAFVRCLAEKMMIYALGRELTPDDRCTIDLVIDELKKDEYKFASLVKAIVRSDAFRMRGTL
jgi:hypothetical protein